MKATGTDSVLVMGEALVDLVIRAGSDSSNVTAVPGGSPANVALALSRLGVDVDLVAWFGRDDYGTMIAEHLAASNVRIVPGSDQAAFTPTAQAHLDASGAATYTFNLEWAPLSPIAVPETAKIAHTGSIGAVLQPGASTVLDAFKRAHVQALTTYDPNARPTLMGEVSQARAIVEDFVREADVVKVSDEDLEWLYEGADPVASAQTWTDEFGVTLLVITRGKQGPIAWTPTSSKVEFTPAKVKVVDTVGAGDTFMGGLIDTLWRRGFRGAHAASQLALIGDDVLREILSDASEVADIVVQRRGANPPWASELGR